jgi:hypothetical protein
MKHDLHDTLGHFVLHTCSGPAESWTHGAAPYLLTYITITWRSRAIPIRGEAGTRVHMALLIYEHLI